jgi:hypothetical protein
MPALKIRSAQNINKAPRQAGIVAGNIIPESL